jgi:diguanylate cyclase (GGDEF)-like protein
MVIEILILNSFNRRNANKTSLMLLDQVVNIIEENEESEDELIETLKEDYIIRAQTVAYLLDAKPEAEQDVAELQKIAGLLMVDEIHIFDETGTIYSGSEPKYYGYSFDSGEQMAYFKPMLEDRTLTMCQDVTPNTAEGKSMMYAITWNETQDKMIQVGIEPLRLLEELRRNELSEVIANMPAYEGIEIWVADAGTREIVASTSGASDCATLDELGIQETDFETDKTVSDVIYIDGYRNYCNAGKTGDYIVVTAYSTRSNMENFLLSLSIEFIYLLIACAIIVYMVKRVLKADDEKAVQMSILVSMADIYNSMILIDLENDVMLEYSAREEVSDAIHKSTHGAAETIKEIMTQTTDENHLESALEFTDVATLPERMQNKKILSQEIVSKVIGWYRASIIAIKADEEGRPTKVIYVTQNIDQEKTKEEELWRKSNLDELTGLYNRRAFEAAIAEREDTVTEQNFVFVSLDVNGLKTVNDTLGHIAGDELLVGAAKCMKQCFDPYGRVYRVGGDEFAAMIFANETQLKSIKKDFKNTTAQWHGTLVNSLSVSSGYVAKRETDVTSIHEIANMADKKMYEKKFDHYKKTRKK